MLSDIAEIRQQRGDLLEWPANSVAKRKEGPSLVVRSNGRPHSRSAGDRPTVGFVLVHQPRGENEKKARGWDHLSIEVLVVDVGLQGQPAEASFSD